MVEWLKALVLKTIVFFNTVGSNPTLSFYIFNFNKAREVLLVNTRFICLEIVGSSPNSNKNEKFNN